MALDPGVFDIVRSVVREESAIVLDDSKGYLVEARLKHLCGPDEFDSLASLASELESRPKRLVDLVVAALTTNETSFFRDTSPFDLLRDEILPGLIERRRNERQIKIWCAASSSGQESLSIAMLIREHFPELAEWNIKLFATDINEFMVERCRAGIYSQLEVARGLPTRLLVKYFTKTGLRWKVDDSILSMVECGQLNLSHTLPPMPPFDVIFMRNVLIYFARDTKARILNDVHRVLKPDGALFLGTAESSLGLCQRFSPSAFDKATCYRPSA